MENAIGATERIVRQFHESRDLRGPERGIAVIAENCRFQDVARGEPQIGPEAYRRDQHRWREAFPDGEVRITNVIVSGDRAAVEFLNRGTRTGRCTPASARSRPREDRWRRATAR